MNVFEVFAKPATAALLLGAALFTPDAGACDSSCTADPWTEVITREDLLHHGVSRLSDVFAFSSRWHAPSIDAYHLQSAGPAPVNERWDVYVDGIPVSTRLLGRNQLNALPVTVFDVACIELVSGPDLRGMSFSPSGSIHIRTDTPDFGHSYEGAIAAGNEINDPGPFRYTHSDAPNVDRIGPIGTAGISFNTGALTGRVAGRLDEFHVTDDILLPRQKHLYHVDPKPRINVASFGVTSSAGPTDRRHRLLVGVTETEDLAFFTPVGHEIPTRHRLDVVGGFGRMPFPAGSIRYAASYTRGDLGYRPNRQGVRLDWREDRITAEAEANLNGVRLGGGLRATEVHTQQPLSDPRILTTRLSAGASLSITPAWNQDLIVEWKQRGDRPIATGYASTDVRIAQKHRLTLTGSYGHVMPDDQELWMWIDRGYALPGVDSVDTAPLLSKSFPRLLTVDASWTAAAAPGLKVSVWSFYRLAENDYFPTFEIAYVPDTHGFDVQTALHREAAGSTAGGGVTVDLARGLFSSRFTYVFESVAAGDSLYRDLRMRIPTQRITVSATYTPVDRFSLSTLVRYTAATRWPDYEAASRQSGDAYLSALPEYFLVDVSASKRMWRDALVLSLALRNILDQPVRSHPAGIVSHMALHFSARLNITSVTGY